MRMFEPRRHERFFVQAEDGIRDLTVTGVQTGALPILPAGAAPCAGTKCCGTSGGRRGRWSAPAGAAGVVSAAAAAVRPFPRAGADATGAAAAETAEAGTAGPGAERVAA